MDEKYRTAMAMATANEGWVEKAFWREQTNELLAIPLVLLVYWPVTILKIVTIGAIGIGAVVALGYLIAILFNPLRWDLWLGLLLSAAGPTAFLWVLRRIEPAIKNVLPNQFLCVLYLLISSRGLVILASHAKPVFLPWSCIVGYRFTGDAMTLTSQMAIDYAAADGQTATILLDGEEYKQPLGEIVDVLQARTGDRLGPVVESGPFG
jgi:hypothetical protein